MSISLNAASIETFNAAVDALSKYNSGSRLISANFAVAIAVLAHRDVAGSKGSRAIGTYGSPLLETGPLQSEVCDRTWVKRNAFLPADAEGGIYKPFTTSFKSPAGNNWRNSFDPQGGLGCDAPYNSEFLLAEEFLGEHRLDCFFRDEESGQCKSPAGFSASPTCFNPNKKTPPPGPQTLALSRPKLLARGIGPSGKRGYWFVEPTVDTLADLLGKDRNRVPALAFAAALYGGSDYWLANDSEISVARLQADLALDASRFYTLFDPDETNPFNRAIADLESGWKVAPFNFGSTIDPSSHTNDGTPPIESEMEDDGAETDELENEQQSVRDSVPSDPLAFEERDPEAIVIVAGSEQDPVRRARLLERATRGHQRTLNALAYFLSPRFELTEQLSGFDLRAQSEASGSYLFEIKTWTVNNLSKQVRSGWAQLMEYSYRGAQKGLPTPDKMFLVFNREPPANFWAWEWLAASFGIIPCWIDGKSLKTFDAFADQISPLK